MRATTIMKKRTYLSATIELLALSFRSANLAGFRSRCTEAGTCRRLTR
ncbi:hypothetical protein OKW34_003998 [Paraburkholderia youngii]